MLRKGNVSFIMLLVLIPLCVGINFSEAKTTTIKFSSPFPASDPRTQSYQYWGDLVNKETEGRVKVVIFPGGSLIPLKEHYHAISRGSIGGGLLISSFLDPIIPELVVTSLAGTIPVHEPKEVLKVEKEIKPIMNKIFEKHGIKYLFATYEGEICFIVRKGKDPITKVADLKGLKMRDAGKYTSIFLRDLGVSTVTLGISQVVTALQYGTVDGVMFNWLTAQGIKAADVAPSLTYLGFYGTWVFTGMNLDMFKGLSSGDQQILMQAAEKAAEYSVKQGEKARDDFFANPGGFKIYYLPKEELQKLLKALHEVKEEILKKTPPSGKELAQALEKAAR